MTQAAVLVDAGDGVHLHPDSIAAAVTVVGGEGWWTDLFQARPRARARSSTSVRVVIDTDGGLHYPPTDGLEVDRYEDPADQPGMYADARAESEAYWAAIDERRGRS